MEEMKDRQAWETKIDGCKHLNGRTWFRNYGILFHDLLKREDIELVWRKKAKVSKVMTKLLKAQFVSA